MGFIGFQHNPRDTALSLSLLFPLSFHRLWSTRPRSVKKTTLCIFHLRRPFYLSLLFFGTLHSVEYIFPFLLCLSLLFFFSVIYITLPETSFPRFFPNSFSLTSTLPLRFSQVIPCQGKFSESPLCTHRKSCVHQFCLYIHSFSSHDAYFFVLNGFLKKLYLSFSLDL